MRPNTRAMYQGAMGVLIVLLLLMAPIKGEPLLTRFSRAAARAVNHASG